MEGFLLWSLVVFVTCASIIALYEHFNALFNTQMDFNDNIIKKVSGLEGLIKGEDFNTIDDEITEEE